MNGRGDALMSRTQGANRGRGAGWIGYAVVAVMAIGIVAMAAGLGGESAPRTGAPAAEHEMGATGVEVGATAPPFELADAVSGALFSPGSMRGRRTMLFFSEGVNCQACMVQTADLETDGALEEAGIDLVSVTTDQPDALREAAQQYGIDTPLLADPTTEMSASYGMLGHGGMGHPHTNGHAFMLVSEDGRVLWHRAYLEMYVKPDKLLRDMRAGAA
jgi:peroxiredoxin